MKVLSLFDGISCGMVALERAGISVERYTAYETDKYAKSISASNYPDIEQCGDVFRGDYTRYRGYDLLIGGSPCTYWSIARNGRETTSDGMGFRLFMQYKRALDESGCNYFLYENNDSIHRDIKAEITKVLGVQPIMINSALVSAQSRKRCYWTNIPHVTQPTDKGIVLKDIIQSGITWQDKSYCLTATYDGAILQNTLERKQRTMIAEPVITVDYHPCPDCDIVITEQGIRSSYKAGGTAQGYHVTLPSAKMRTLAAGHACKEKVIVPYENNVKAKKVYEVRNGQIEILGKPYPIKLPDGSYIIRKLTVTECERLQTLPDGYTQHAGVSKTQCYKAIGNGWTVDVIAHILRNLR